MIYIEEEKWKIIENSIVKNIKENMYSVSTYGRVKNNNTDHILAIHNGAFPVQTTGDRSSCNVSLVRVVYKVFVDPSLPDNLSIWYKDNNPNNLYYMNLYPVTWDEYKTNIFNLNAIRNAGLSNREMSMCGYYQNNAKIMCYCTDEVWKDITEQHIPGIRPWYLVSNYGRIYSKATNSIIKQSIINSGYVRVQLMSYNKSKIDVLVHRIVALVFIPIPNPNEMEVNHKDENGFNNYVGNLEWVTPLENIQYASDIDHGMHYKETFSDNIVRQICEALCNGMSYMEICFYILHTKYTSGLHKRIWLIHKRKIHTNISKDYAF